MFSVRSVFRGLLMEKICEIDFAALSGAEKLEFVHRFDKIVEREFAEYPFETAVIAQLLIFTRWWNSYRLMVSENPTPRILDIVLEKLWDYHEGKLSHPDFVYFSKCLDAAVLEIVTGDTEKLDEDEAYYDFQTEYFGDWDCYYDEFIVDLTYLCCGISDHEMNWTNVESILDGDIADIKVPLFEGIENSDGTAAAIEQRDQEIYSTPRFCQVIALLQKDIRTALENRPIGELRSLYQNEYVFSPEDCAKVTSDWC